MRLKNFKSFKGEHYVGPFLNLTSIVGPNGGGKSSIVEAIVFVLGCSIQVARLIYSAEGEKQGQAGREMYVEALLQQDDLEPVTLKREVGEDNLLKYYYNGDRVSKSEFRGKVKTNLGINYNAIDAFMFSQGKLESSPFIKGGLELTALLEELCGSADQKD